MFAFSDYQALVDSMVRAASAGASAITDDQRDQALKLAVVEYSKYRPRKVVTDLASIDGYRFSAPAAEPEILSIEYPIGQNPPHYVRQHDWIVYPTPEDGTVVLLREHVPIGNNARFTMQQAHNLDADGSTFIDDTPARPICSFAAADLLDQLAAKFSGDIDASVAAANVQQRTPAQEYAARARVLRQTFYDALGVADPGQVKAAGAVAELHSPGAHLTHRGRR